MKATVHQPVRYVGNLGFHIDTSGRGAVFLHRWGQSKSFNVPASKPRVVLGYIDERIKMLDRRQQMTGSGKAIEHHVPPQPKSLYPWSDDGRNKA